MSCTSQRTVTINAAFLREIKLDHLELTRLLSQTETLFSQGVPSWTEKRKAFDLLAKVRDRLAMHFSLEEAYGYMEDALEVAPRLTGRAFSLRAQHSELYRCIAALSEFSEDLVSRNTQRDDLKKLSVQVTGFLERLRAHESAENELILEALDDDVGVGD